MARATGGKARKQRHDPLLKDLDSAQGNLKKVKNRRDATGSDDESEFVDSKASRKILQLAKEQQDEIAEEENVEAQIASQDAARFKRLNYDDEDEDESEQEENISDFEPEEFGEGEEEEELVEIDEEDAAMFEQYFKKPEDFNSLGGSYNLADKIMASIREKQEQVHSMEDDLAYKQESTIANGSTPSALRNGEGVALPEKVIRAYTTVGSILKTWTHGKLPKLFKVIPSLRNWQDVLYVTNPEASLVTACGL